MSNTLLKLRNLSYRDGTKDVLQQISLDIAEGEITTIIGPNGAGKSTLIKLVCGLLQPTMGDIVRSQDVSIGYMPQKLQLAPSMPLKVSRFLSLADTSRTARLAALEKTGVAYLNSSSMHTLSGGELQRVLLARAILRRPKLLVLDEPLQGVDINGQVALYRLIASLREEQGCAILMVSHDLHLVMAQTDHVICLNQHVCCHGEPESVSRHPEYLKLFGKQGVEELAVYTHKHDHHHDAHGHVIDCGEGCDHDV